MLGVDVNGGTWARDARLVALAPGMLDELGESVYDDQNVFRVELDAALKRLTAKLSAAEKKVVYDAVSWRCEDAPPVIKKVHRSAETPDPLHGLFVAEVGGKVGRGRVRTGRRPARYRADSAAGGRWNRGVPAPRSSPVRWRLLVQAHAVKIGYDISFNRYFYKAEPMRMLDEIRADIVALEQSTQDFSGKSSGNTGREGNPR